MMCLHSVFVCPGGEEMYGGVGFGGGPGGGQRDEGREQRGAETKTLQQEGQRLVSRPSQNTQTSTCGCRMSIKSICSECVVRLCLCGRAASGGEEQHVDQRHQRSPTSVRTRGGGGSRGGPLQENLHHLRTWTHLWEDVDTHTHARQHWLSHALLTRRRCLCGTAPFTKSLPLKLNSFFST